VKIANWIGRSDSISHTGSRAGSVFGIGPKGGDVPTPVGTV
jgi:hypothetical protein